MTLINQDINRDGNIQAPSPSRLEKQLWMIFLFSSSNFCARDIAPSAVAVPPPLRASSFGRRCLEVEGSIEGRPRVFSRPFMVVDAGDRIIQLGPVGHGRNEVTFDPGKSRSAK
jgi:hypothetical protein